MRRTTQIALTALNLIIFANSILTAPIPTIHTMSPLQTVRHPSYGDRLAVRINAHHTSSQRKCPPSKSMLAYNYPPGRSYISEHDDEREGTDPDTVKKPSYKNRKAVGINKHHTSSQHKSPGLVLAYSYPPGRLYDPKMRLLESPSSETREDYEQKETKHVPSSFSVPQYDVMPDRDEKLPSSWILMHWKVPYGYINHSKLLTENVFEWALWLLGLALVIAVGMEILSVSNGRMERFMEGAEDSYEDDDGNGGLGVDEKINPFMKPKKIPVKDQPRTWYANMSTMTSQCKHKNSTMEESTDLEGDVDENGMEKSSW